MIQPSCSSAVLEIDPDRLSEVGCLLGRYPAISDEETDQIVAFLRKGPTIDRALIDANFSLPVKRCDSARPQS